MPALVRPWQRLVRHELPCCECIGFKSAHTDVVEAVCGMLNRSHTRSALLHLPGAYVHTVLVPSGGDIEVDAARLAELGVHDVVEVPSVRRDGQCFYDPDMLVSSIADVLAAAA